MWTASKENTLVILLVCHAEKHQHVTHVKKCETIRQHVQVCNKETGALTDGLVVNYST
jgi:hypothetical protein